MENILESACQMAKITDYSHDTLSQYINTPVDHINKNITDNHTEEPSSYLLGDSGIFSPRSADFSSFLEEIQSNNAVENYTNFKQSVSEINSTGSSESGVFDISINNSGLDSTTNSLPSPVTGKSDTERQHKRPDFSFVEMIAQCILASLKDKVALSDIYEFILKQYPYFEDAPPAWRISVRHHLSTCEGFVKVGRVPLSRGFWWAIHPACMEDFQKGIIERKVIRKRLGNIKPKKRTRKTTAVAAAKESEKQHEKSNEVKHSASDINNPSMHQYQQSLNNSLAEHLQQNPQSSIDSSTYQRLHDLTNGHGLTLPSTPIRGIPNMYAGHSTPISNVYGSYPYCAQQVNYAAGYSPIPQHSTGYYRGTYPSVEQNSYDSNNHNYWSDSHTNGYYSYYGNSPSSGSYYGSYNNTNFSLPYGQYTTPGKNVQSGNGNMSRYTPY